MSLPDFEQALPREVLGLRRRLRNLGFEQAACRDLAQLAADADNRHTRRAAAWELVEWFANRGDREAADEARKWLDTAVEGETDPAWLRAAAVMASEICLRLGDVEGSLAAIEAAPEWKDFPDLLLARANLCDTEDKRLEWFNRALWQCALESVTASSESEPLLDRLRVGEVVSAAAPEPAPLVSVIVPAYECESTIRTALESLLTQSWPNLEILVVDDASGDRTRAVVSKYMDWHPRLRLLRNDFNRGPYFARNIGLHHAGGDYVTCHDADDWSHPRKIEMQVRHLLEHHNCVANTSGQVRATDDLQFHRRGKRGHYIFPNVSSLMFRRRDVLNRIGYWDCVRFGADAEFIERLQRAFGDDAVQDIAEAPLALLRQSDDSLTGDEVFGFPGWFMGARREYRQSQRYFHARVEGKPRGLRYEFPQSDRPFPVPEPMWPERMVDEDGTRSLDVISACDFRFETGAMINALEEVKVQARMGLRTGLVPLYRYEADPPGRRIPHRVRRVTDGDAVQMLVRGERIRCDLLLVRDPSAFSEPRAYLPDIEADEVRVIVDRAPGNYPGGMSREAFLRCDSNLREWLGIAPLWQAASGAVHRALDATIAETGANIRLADEVWPPVLNCKWWRRRKQAARGQRIRIGCHVRGDNPANWPSDRRSLRQTWPVTKDVEVRMLGGTEVPARIDSRWVADWKVESFGQRHPREFLAELDVFVHSPHPDQVPAPTRPVLEAMAAGVPVVLPPVFEPVFGSAAIYARGRGIARTIKVLVADDVQYERQVELGAEFVRKHHDYAMHRRRLERLLPARQTAAASRGRQGSDEWRDCVEQFEKAIRAIDEDLRERGLPFIEHRSRTARQEFILPADCARELRSWIGELEDRPEWNISRKDILLRQNEDEADGRLIGIPAYTFYWYLRPTGGEQTPETLMRHWRIRVSFFSESEKGRVFHLRNKLTRLLPADAPLPASLDGLWRDVRKTVSGVAPKPINQADFPVDMVVTWVNDADPAWQEKFERYRHHDGDKDSSAVLPRAALNPSRFRNRDELRYCLRAINMYAPFVRRIYIVSDDQHPEWLKEDQRVRVVSHRDIFTEDTAWPVFSSRPIELNLHRIDGLAEQFIYFNDDFFLAGPVDVEDFFLPNGLARVFLSRNKLDARGIQHTDRATVAAHKNAARLFEERFSVSLTGKPAHAPLPVLKSACHALETDFEAAAAQTRANRFRHWSDVSWTQLLPLYMLYRGDAVEGQLESRYVDLLDGNLRERLEQLMTDPVMRSICINETEGVRDRFTEEFVLDWLARRFPVPGPWERQ